MGLSGARSLRRFAAIVLISVTGGCSTMEFYSQAVLGQMSLLAKRRAVGQVAEDPATPDEVRRKLMLAMEVKAFAEDVLGLPVGDSYDSYVDTGRRYVVWNVFAAPEFSLTMKSFCYPIAGCVTYRGFFDESDAREFAGNLEQDGYDVFVGGVAAYSTLGWFDDPILNTFLARSNVNLAALLFHELAHKIVYVPGDTSFNESFATTVERVALKRWLAERGEPGAFDAYLKREARQREVIQLIGEARQALEEEYASGKTAVDMRSAKSTVIEGLRADYHVLRESWGEGDEFGFWMQTEINNAKLGTIGNYNDWVESFENMLAEADGDLGRFLDRVAALAEKQQPERNAALAALTD